MKNWRIVAVLLLILVLAGSTACNPFGRGKQEAASQQLAEVVRGDLTVSISGSGNIEVADEAKLTFGVSGKIDKIYVKEGDRVSQGDVLARLDTDALELALTQAQLGVTQAEVAQAQAEAGVAQAQLTRDQAKAARDQAEASVVQTKAARAQAQAARDEAEYNLNQLTSVIYASQDRIDIAESQLEAAELQLEAAESQLEVAELQPEVAESQLKVAELQLGVAEIGVSQAQQSLEAAKQSLEQAQKQLDEATITAPFGGVIVSVSANEGDTVSAARTIVRLIDLTSMELKVSVDEIDIPSVRLKQRAIISVDALPDVQFEGEVTFISLLPTVETGVVLYNVTISFNVPEDSDLRIGMSATADIIVDERSNVLLVPNRAIEQDSQGNPVVRVKVGEQIQQRAVVIGISDGFQTEIVDGLGEGEIVVIEKRAKSKSSGTGGLLFHD